MVNYFDIVLIIMLCTFKDFAVYLCLNSSLSYTNKLFCLFVLKNVSVGVCWLEKTHRLRNNHTHLDGNSKGLKYFVNLSRCYFILLFSVWKSWHFILFTVIFNVAMSNCKTTAAVSLLLIIVVIVKSVHRPTRITRTVTITL